MFYDYLVPEGVTVLTVIFVWLVGAVSSRCVTLSNEDVYLVNKYLDFNLGRPPPE